MRIDFKENWSEQFIYGDKTPGFFVGREQEIKALKSIIASNESSSILISSVRGIGKTSFVHKALSELNNVHPVFVNIGHALANAEVTENKPKKAILVSLIRAAHFNTDFKNDPQLGILYKRCFGKYTEENTQSQIEETTNEIGFSRDLNINSKQIVQLLSVLFVALGFSLDSEVWRWIVGIGGISVLFLSVNWKRKWTDNLLQKKTLVVDDSTEYLEIEFDNWLRDQKKKIVFVIDELDKIEEEKSLIAIKEYKNLFSRSLAHFVFISSQKAFDLISKDREGDASEGGIFPTLFSHVFYLSLPKASELKSYLNEIVKTNSLGESEKEELANYLLFRSGNDFFELKRLLSDVISYGERGEPFIDTDEIKIGDVFFSRTAKLYGYVEDWFLQKQVKTLKKFWKQNSQLQKEVFAFLNNRFFRNFDESAVNTSVLKALVEFLIDIGILSSSEKESDLNPGSKIIAYQWTNKYKREKSAPLLKEDEEFNTSFQKLIRLANDLDDLPESYKENEFDDYESVAEGRDGQNLSGVNLHSTYSTYADIFKRLKDPAKRISVTVDSTKEAVSIINEQLTNIYKDYFQIAINAMTKIFESNTNVYTGESLESPSYNIAPVFSALPGFLEVASVYKSFVCGRRDHSKYVLMIRYFEDEEHIKGALRVLRNNRNILIINLIHTNRKRVSSPKVKEKDEKKSPQVKIENFVRFEFNEFRQLADLMILVENHLR